MTLEIESIRYAHGAGHTDICYNHENRRIFTCGSDGYVRIWDGLDDDDSSSDFVADQALSVACGKDQYLVATNNNYVQRYSYPEKKRDKIVCRFSAPVTYVTISNSGNFIVACSCDMEIQVIETQTNKVTTLAGHTAPVLGVFVDPLDEYLVSSSCDGSIKIWKLESGTPIKSFKDVVPKKNDFFKAVALGHCAWKSISGLLLATPKGLEVVVYKRHSWNEVFKLSSSHIESDVSAVLFSPCGNYIAAATIMGEVIIWEIKQKSEVCFYRDPKKVGISGVIWHPDGSRILFCDRLGRLGVLTGISEAISKHSPPIEENKNVYQEKPKKMCETIDDSLFLEDNDIDDNDDNCISLEKIKSMYQNISENDYTDNFDKGDANDEDSSSLAETNRRDDLTSMLTKPQKPFQPSSTPFDCEPRCLCYNHIGVVRYYNSDQTIDIQFHDTMFHHSLFLRSFGVCTMATLSEKVLCLGVPSIDNNLSKLTCILLSSFSGNKEWTIHMPLGEDIVALSASGNWVALATSSNHLRIFNYAGTQKQILSLPGSAVCMAGFNENLFIVCHAGLGLMGNQNLGFIIYKVCNIYVKVDVHFQSLPLSSKSTLKWLGFSDEGTPCTYDSLGIMQLLGHDSQYWVAICNTKNQLKSSSDNYFIIGLSEINQNIRCVLCKNSQYPIFINNPNVVEIPLKMPLCEMDDSKSDSEETFWRLMFSIHTVQNSCMDENEFMKKYELPMKRAILKLFGDAANNSEDMRAMEIATFMTQKPLDIAIQYANNQGKTYLVDKLKLLKPLNWSYCGYNSQDLPHKTDIKIKGRKIEGQNTNLGNNVVDSQQDLFEDCTEIQDVNEPSTSEEPHFTPECSYGSSRNPFKKSIEQVKENSKGLKYFDELNQQSLDQSKVCNVNKPLKLKLPSIKGKNCNQNAGVVPKKPTFVEWFSKRKAVLLQEYPDIPSCELTKLGMKIYKAEIVNSTNESVVNESDSIVYEGKKRNLEGESEKCVKRYKSIGDSK